MAGKLGRWHVGRQQQPPGCTAAVVAALEAGVGLAVKEVDQEVVEEGPVVNTSCCCKSCCILPPSCSKSHSVETDSFLHHGNPVSCWS